MHVLFKWPSALEWRSCVLGFSLMSCRVVYALLLCRNGSLSACRCRHALGCLLVKFRFKKRKRNYRLVSFWSFRGRGRLAACDASRPPSDFEGSDSCANPRTQPPNIPREAETNQTTPNSSKVTPPSRRPHPRIYAQAIRGTPVRPLDAA